MACAGERDPGHHLRIGLRDAAAHELGHETVLLSVDQQDGHLRRRGAVCRSQLAETEVAEQNGRHAGRRACEQSHQGRVFLRDVPDDPDRGIERTVCRDALDVRGKVFRRGHQHGRAAHGDADQADLRIAAEAADRIIHPTPDVFALPDAERDRVAFAFAGASLFGHQHVVAHLHQHGGAAGKVPGGRAPVAVHADAQRSAWRDFVVTADQFQSVEGRDAHLFVFLGVHLADHAEDLVGHRSRLVGEAVFEIVVLIAFRRMERDAVCCVKSCEQSGRDGSRRDGSQDDLRLFLHGCASLPRGTVFIFSIIPCPPFVCNHLTLRPVKAYNEI